MPIKLTRDAPVGITAHRSGDEHYGKHIGDIDDVCVFARAHGRSIDYDQVSGAMYDNGLIVARHGSTMAAGEVAGFAIGTMKYEGRRPSVLRVESMLVDPLYRRKGVAGFMLGRLITSRPPIVASANMSVIKMAPTLECGDDSFPLPGDHVIVTQQGTQDGELDLRRFTNFIIDQRVPMLLESDGVATLYRDGKIVTDHVPEGEHVYLKATNILNGLA